jgi:hypothetical protein
VSSNNNVAGSFDSPRADLQIDQFFFLVANPKLLLSLLATKPIISRLRSLEVIWLLPSAAAKFADLVDEKAEGSRPDDKIQSPRSPRSAPIDEG